MFSAARSWGELPLVKAAAEARARWLATGRVAWLTVTFFPSQFARERLQLGYQGLEHLAEEIKAKSAASKEALPFVKLAMFGDQRSINGCLRTNFNMRMITGIEGDYSGGQGVRHHSPRMVRLSPRRR